MLPTFEDYCAQIARLPDQSSFIDSSTLTVYTIGPFAAEVEGQLTFSDGYVLSVWELLDLDSRTIRSYSYELDRAGERVWWYDPTGHPDDPALAATHPHHRHVSPNIKHHRVPAPEISFTRPNLPFLIRQAEQLLTS